MRGQQNGANLPTGYVNFRRSPDKRHSAQHLQVSVKGTSSSGRLHEMKAQELSGAAVCQSRNEDMKAGPSLPTSMSSYDLLAPLRSNRAQGQNREWPHVESTTLPKKTAGTVAVFSLQNEHGMSLKCCSAGLHQKTCSCATTSCHISGKEIPLGTYKTSNMGKTKQGKILAKDQKLASASLTSSPCCEGT